MVVPTGKTFPAGTPVRAIVTDPALSDAVAVPRTASPIDESQDAAAAPVFTVTSAGAVIIGATLSMTVIVCVADALFALASVAVQLRVMRSGLADEPAPPLLV